MFLSFYEDTERERAGERERHGETKRERGERGREIRIEREREGEREKAR
jgi:hypothetical protein